LKTKAGNDSEEDLRIAKAVLKEIGDEAFIRPDANCGYGPEEALPLLKKLSDLGVRYYEDPCAWKHTEALNEIRSETDIKILINMGFRTPTEVRQILNSETADFLMPDTPVSGGIHKVAELTRVATAWNIPCLMHCSHDLGLKTAAITQIAAGIPNFSGPNDTCYHGLIDDIITQPFQFEDGKLRVPEGPGLGVEVDEHKLEKYKVSS